MHATKLLLLSSSGLNQARAAKPVRLMLCGASWASCRSIVERNARTRMQFASFLVIRAVGGMMRRKQKSRRAVKFPIPREGARAHEGLPAFCILVSILSPSTGWFAESCILSVDRGHTLQACRVSRRPLVTQALERMGKRGLSQDSATAGEPRTAYGPDELHRPAWNGQKEWTFNARNRRWHLRFAPKIFLWYPLVDPLLEVSWN